MDTSQSYLSLGGGDSDFGVANGCYGGEKASMSMHHIRTYLLRAKVEWVVFFGWCCFDGIP